MMLQPFFPEEIIISGDTKRDTRRHVAFDIGPIIIGINFIVGLVILALASIAAKRLAGSTLFWVSLLFLITGALFVTHASVEFFTIGGEEGFEALYGITALVATIVLAFSLIIIDITTKMLGVRS
jgi:hypothetical protein